MLRVTAALSLVLSLSLMAGHSQAQNAGTGPIFVDGQAQVVPAFNASGDWVREHLWVETEFDSDKNGSMWMSRARSKRKHPGSRCL